MPNNIRKAKKLLQYSQDSDLAKFDELTKIDDELEQINEELKKFEPPFELRGEKGDKGDTGDVGPEGPQGDVGPPGIDGKDGESIVGPKGDPGESIIGPQGPTGIGIDGKSVDPKLIVEEVMKQIKIPEVNTGIVISDTPPKNPKKGELWIDSSQSYQL